MNTKAVQIKQRIIDFLKKVKKLGESALIYSSPDLRGVVKQEVNKIFENRKIQYISPSMTEKEKVDKVFNSSLKEGSVLMIFLNRQSLPVVTRRLEQVMEDGHVPVNVGNSWRKVEPVENWQTIVWINRNDIKEDEFPLRRLFVHKLVVAE